MFVGHFAPAFVLASRSRVVPLSALLAGTTFLDLLFAVLGPLGWEKAVVHDPPVFANLELIDLGISHSLLGAGLWSVLAILLGRKVWGSWEGGSLLGMAVFSHYALDVLSHHPDMAVVGFGFKPDWRLGTGLAAWPVAFFAVEAVVCLWAVHLYDPHNRRLRNIVLVLLAFWSNQVFGFLLPEAPGPVELGVTTLFGFAVAGWALHRGAMRGTQGVKGKHP